MFNKKEYKETMSEIITYLDKLKDEGIDDLSLDNTKNLKERIFNDEKRIMVTGEFSSGKSTFINAVIGKNILKHSATATTAAIVYIHNTAKESPLYDTCKVSFDDGKSVNINRLSENISELHKYTAEQSEENVADTIKCVDIYTDLLDNNDDFTIIDTPGLNSMSEKHKELTFEEIQKANICIFILPMYGVTDNTVNLLNYYKNYQNTFIILRNFIDQFEESKTELLDEVKEALTEKVFGDSPCKVSYCAVSALKAMAARCNDIKYLYANDTEEADKEKIYSESGFENFKKVLLDNINDKSFVKQKMFDECQLLCDMLNRASDILEMKYNFEKSLYYDVSRPKLLENAQKKQAELEERRKEYVEILNKYVEAEFIDKENILRSEITEGLEKINTNISADIDLIDDFEKYNDMMQRCIIENNVNKAIKDFSTHIMELKSVCISNVVNVMYKKIDYYTDTQTKVAPPDFYVDNNSLKKEIDKFKKEDERDKINKQLRDEEEQILISGNKLKEIDKEIEKTNGEITQTERKITAAKTEYTDGINKIGKEAPDPIEKTDTRPVERSGLGRFLDIFKTRYETYTYYDNSNVEEWNEAVRDLEEQKNRRLNKLNNNLNIAQRQLNQLMEKRETEEAAVSSHNAKIKRYNSKISELKD